MTSMEPRERILRGMEQLFLDFYDNADFATTLLDRMLKLSCL
jgi:hypothetical protein